MPWFLYCIFKNNPDLHLLHYKIHMLAITWTHSFSHILWGEVYYYFIYSTPPKKIHMRQPKWLQDSLQINNNNKATKMVLATQAYHLNVYNLQVGKVLLQSCPAYRV